MNLIVDLNNIVSVMRHGKLGRPKTKSQKEPMATESLFLYTIRNIIQTAMETSCNRVVVVRDSRGLWRRDIYPLYKVSSDVDKKEDYYFENVLEASDMVFDFFKNMTSAMALKCDGAEADDVIGVWCRYSDVPNVIMSSDKDYIQLISPTTKLYYPRNKEYRKSDDPAYDLFLKCIRGDASDNIMSVWKGLRETKIKKAWEDSIEMVNLMESTTPSGEKFKDLFNLNKSIIDLSLTPHRIVDKVLDDIENYQPAKYSEIKVMKWIYDQLNIDMSGDLNQARSLFTKTPIFLK